MSWRSLRQLSAMVPNATLIARVLRLCKMRSLSMTLSVVIEATVFAVPPTVRMTYEFLLGQFAETTILTKTL
jgi:hypothetical protein